MTGTLRVINNLVHAFTRQWAGSQLAPDRPWLFAYQLTMEKMLKGLGIDFLVVVHALDAPAKGVLLHVAECMKYGQPHMNVTVHRHTCLLDLL